MSFVFLCRLGANSDRQPGSQVPFVVDSSAQQDVRVD